MNRQIKDVLKILKEALSVRYFLKNWNLTEKVIEPLE